MEISRSLWLSSAMAASAMAFHGGAGGGILYPEHRSI